MYIPNLVKDSTKCDQDDTFPNIPNSTIERKRFVIFQRQNKKHEKPVDESINFEHGDIVLLAVFE